MKKYLLLLVLAISSATCFAQQHQSSISVQKEQTEDEAIIEVLNHICDMERELLNFDWFYKYDQANYFLEQYFLQAKTLCYEEIEKQFLDIYYPYVKNDDGTSVRQYIGGLTLDMANQKYNEYLDRIREIHIAMETSSYLYSTYFATFQAEYSVVAMHSLDELASKSGDYTIKIQEYYNKAIV